MGMLQVTAHAQRLESAPRILRGYASVIVQTFLPLNDAPGIVRIFSRSLKVNMHPSFKHPLDQHFLRKSFLGGS